MAAISPNFEVGPPTIMNNFKMSMLSGVYAKKSQKKTFKSPKTRGRYVPPFSISDIGPDVYIWRVKYNKYYAEGKPS